MSIESHATKQPVRPSYPNPTRSEKIAMIFVAVLVSSTLLGGMLSLFEMRSEQSAMAGASVKTQPSTDGLAVRKASITSGNTPHTSTRSIPPSLARSTYSGNQSGPRILFAISTTM